MLSRTIDFLLDFGVHNVSAARYICGFPFFCIVWDFFPNRDLFIFFFESWSFGISIVCSSTVNESRTEQNKKKTNKRGPACVVVVFFSTP